MRIVHTSDWHAGRMWKGLARTDELEMALAGLASFLSREEVDLLLVTGDIFDHAAPSPEAERVVFQFLKRVGQLGVESVVIAGNHDHAGRMDAWGALTALAGVRTVSRPLAPKEGGVLEVVTRRGERAIVAALPFASVGDLLRAAEVAGGETEARQRYADQLRRAIHRLSQEFREDAVNLLMAHTHFEGAVLARSERAVHCTEQWTAMPEALATNAHYIALGHIHRPQEIASAPPARYAGSPMQLDFGEMGDEKSFVLIDASARLPAKITLVPYEGARPLHELRLDADSLRLCEEAGLGAVPGVNAELSARAWLRVVVALGAPDPDVAARVRKLFPRAVEVRVDLPATPIEVASPTAPALSAREVYGAYVLARRKREPDAALLDAFDALRAECSGPLGAPEA
jgi:exonuclease SbcD